METENKTDNPAGGHSPQDKKTHTVTLEVTSSGETKTAEVQFHTPTLIERISEIDDAAKVRIIAHGDGKDNQTVLLDAVKADAIAALEASTIKPGDIAAHVQKFVQFLADHSNIRAMSVEAVFIGQDKGDSGFGFVVTTPSCTAAQAVALVNCCDANVDEFLAKTKLDVPGRGQAKGGIIAPTQEQVKELG